MRTFLFLSLFCFASGASASYDLMLLGDNTTAGAQKIVRYDPVTGASFGSFGQGYFTNNINGITADVNTGLCYVQSLGNTYVFNYSTGEFIKVFLTDSGYADIYFAHSSNSLTLGNGFGSGTNPARRYDPNTESLTASYSASYVSTAPLDRVGSSLVFSYGLISVNTIGLYAFNPGGGAPVASFNTGIPWTAAVTVRQAVFIGSKIYGVYGDGSTYSRFYTMDTTVSGFTGTQTSTNFGSSFTGTTNIANGHGNLLYLRCGNQLTLFNPVLGLTLGTRTLPIGTATAVGGMAVILAPEPSTWFGLGFGSLGLLAMMRRKRNR